MRITRVSRISVKPCLLAAATLTALLSACAVGPDYKKPEVANPATFKELGDWKPAAPADLAKRGEWWTAFGDSSLNGLMDQLKASNQDIKTAEANYRQSLALLQSARAGYFPTVGASISGTKGNRQTAVPGNVATTDAFQLQASWAPDIWGKVRRSVESSDANAKASEATLAASVLSDQAQLAQTYFNIRVSDKQIALLRDTIKEYERALQLTRNELKAGTVTQVDVLQAETQLNSTRAQLADAELSTDQLKHALAVLVGKAPSEFDLVAGDLPPSHPDPVPPIPSALLERRPDIASAERKLASLNAQIGVAESAWFPSLTLGGALGYQSLGLGNLFNAPNRVWSVGPQLAQALFDGGARSAQSDAAKAAYDAGVAQYRQTVLSAFQEVEDNIVAIRKLGDEIRLQQAAVDAARKTTVITLNQYKAGTVNYLNVVTAQTTQLTAERTLWQLIGRDLTARVTLVTALGGMWS